MVRPFRKGEHLEDAAVESDKILLDQLISGFEVVIEANLKERADLVVTVEGQPVTIGDQDQEEIEQQFMMVEAPESVPEEPMFDEGETSLNRSHSLGTSGLLWIMVSSFRMEANTHIGGGYRVLFCNHRPGVNASARLGLFEPTRPFLQSTEAGKRRPVAGWGWFERVHFCNHTGLGISAGLEEGVAFAIARVLLAVLSIRCTARNNHSAYVEKWVLNVQQPVSHSAHLLIIFSQAAMAFVNFTPFSYIRVTRVTTGCLPFHVMFSAILMVVSASVSNIPFQYCSRAPWVRSTGLYLLW